MEQSDSGVNSQKHHSPANWKEFQDLCKGQGTAQESEDHTKWDGFSSIYTFDTLKYIYC